MRKLTRLLLSQTLSMLILSLAFFTMILVLADVYSNLTRFLSAGIPLEQILYNSFLYSPKALLYALPIALLFAVSYTLGTLYAQNQLISVFSAGISLSRFIAPLLVLGTLLSAGYLIFEDTIVIPALRQKEELTRTLQGGRSEGPRSNVTVLGERGQIIYNVNFYNLDGPRLMGVILLIRDENLRLMKRVDAEWAEWVDEVWVLKKNRVFTRQAQGPFAEVYQEEFTDPRLTELPETFAQRMVPIEQLNLAEARIFIESLRRAGFSFREAETDYWSRIFMVLTPVIVVFLSSSLGGRYKKNILLMSLLTSLVITVLYFVFNMLAMLLSKSGILPPPIGGSLAGLTSLALGIWLFQRART